MPVDRGKQLGDVSVRTNIAIVSDIEMRTLGHFCIFRHFTVLYLDSFLSNTISPSLK